MHKYIFVDTDVFEQFQPITDIDWLSLADCASATLIIPAITLKQLNEHKDSALRGRLKRKAKSVLTTLRGYAKETAPVYVRPSVEVQFRPAEPTINFASYQLNEKVEDDRLLAAGIQFALENHLDGATVLVTTGDFGVELRAKSQTLIAPLALPDTHRLPPEPDDEERQIRELQRRVQMLERSAPDLTLAFQDGRTFTKITISSPQDYRREAEELLVQERSRRPFLQHTTPSPIMGWSFSLSTPQDIDEYNKSLQSYLESLPEWLAAEVSWKEWQVLTARLQFQLSNKGGAPGAGIHTDLHFPDGCTVLGESELPKLPAKPAAPIPPDKRTVAALSAMERYVRSSSDFKTPQFTIPRPENTRLSWIKKTNSYLVRFEVQQLKHTLTELLPPVYVHFSSLQDAVGFRVEYKIVARNYPEPFCGTLDVEVLKN